MALTLNQVQAKIEAMCLAHKMVRSFFYGLKTDLLTQKTTKYPAVFLDDNGGTISPDAHSITLDWRLWFLDLVNVDAYSNQNDIDVTSDMMSIAVDIVSQMNRPENGWVLSAGNRINQVAENDNDMPWGVSLDFSIRYPYTQNICEVPTTYTAYSSTGTIGSLTPWGVLAFQESEIPAGLVNGTNKIFTVSKTWLSTNYLEVYVNGARQTPTLHFTASGTQTITFVTAPAAGANLLVDYISTS